MTFSSDAQSTSRSAGARVSNLPATRHNTIGAMAFRVVKKACMGWFAFGDKS
ncbi:MAG: hypothetical protein OXU71_06020 [Gammaproteobacteria bacterium]|nr:hypothetical protein [Gammaproteobacteria bacterium]